MSRTLSEPARHPLYSLENIQHFVLEDASWELYEKLLRDIGQRPIRVTYDSGTMEITSPLQTFIDMLPRQDETSVIKSFVAWVRSNGWAR